MKASTSIIFLWLMNFSTFAASAAEPPAKAGVCAAFPGGKLDTVKMAKTALQNALDAEFVPKVYRLNIDDQGRIVSDGPNGQIILTTVPCGFVRAFQTGGSVGPLRRYLIASNGKETFVSLLDGDKVKPLEPNSPERIRVSGSEGAAHEAGKKTGGIRIASVEKFMPEGGYNSLHEQYRARLVNDAGEDAGTVVITGSQMHKLQYRLSFSELKDLIGMRRVVVDNGKVPYGYNLIESYRE